MDRNRLIASAQKFIQRGQHDKALAAYRELLRADPGDARLMLRMGDIEHQAGRSERAVAAYRQAAEHYMSSGFFTKAVGVLKTMRNIAPEDLELGMELANLYEQISLYGDARKHYREVLEAARKAADYKRQIRALSRLTALDEDHVPTALEYAQLLCGDRREADAIEHLKHIAHVLYRAGRFDDYLQIVDRLLQISPNDLEERIRRARVLLERGETAEAQALLEDVALEDPSSSGLLDLFVEWKTATEGASAAEAALLQAARTALSGGSEEYARIVAVRIKALRRRTQESAAVVAVESPADEAALVDLEGEAEVFVRYQLLDKALAKLDEVLRRSPHRLGACRRRRELLEQKGAPASDVARAWLLEARALAAAGDESEAREAVEAASTWAPEEPSVVRALEQARVEPSGLALLRDDGGLDGAPQLAETPAASLPPGLAVALQGVEQSLADGQLDDAVSTVNQLLVEFPSHAEILARVLDDLSLAIDEQSSHGALADALEGEEELEFVDVETIEIQTLTDEQLAQLQGEDGAPQSEEESDLFSLEEMMLADETASFASSEGWAGKASPPAAEPASEAAPDESFDDDLFLDPDEGEASGASVSASEAEASVESDEAVANVPDTEAQAEAGSEPDLPIDDAQPAKGSEPEAPFAKPILPGSPLESPEFGESTASYSPASWLDRLANDAPSEATESEGGAPPASSPTDAATPAQSGGLFGEALRLPKRAQRASDLLADLMGDSPTDDAASSADATIEGTPSRTESIGSAPPDAPASDDPFTDHASLDMEEVEHGDPLDVEPLGYSDERGRINPVAPLPFSERERALTEAPNSPLAEAIRQRAAGEAMAALMTLEMEREGAFARAAAFESAIAHFELGLYLETVATLADVANADDLADDDLASVRYVEALAYEALAQDHEAIQLFSMLDEVFPGRYSDIPERLRRLRLE